MAGRSTVHYADQDTNNALKKLHNKLRPAGTPVQRVEYILELLLLRIFETKLKRDKEFITLRTLFAKEENENKLFYYLQTIDNTLILETINSELFPFYSNILSHARTVYEKENLPLKVQDQLVLIQEVFKNSNFTNNVNSGNLSEVIEIVAGIDEEHIMKSDLLGDAIESALSETGGNKDIGLFRTPNHIRQFMVGLIQPTIHDTIFDPACGTGGFLFDAFEYVKSSLKGENHWIGEKEQHELRAWFEKHFKEKEIGFPSIDESNKFYRTGVSGIEYLGMIRKMAAVNFYIRGLNPANIKQGDSLALFKPVNDANTKTVILANPPFGATRDQDSYPDVWTEYSKESETTILFVKLMLESLKEGGRCAVVVSEGFLTWEQSSAKALRKMLLEDTNLKAIFSLPQGVFISKGGVGPKTSILYFEKGEPTESVWYYKIKNDGFTTGTNRRPKKDCQLPEALNLFLEYIQKDKALPNNKHSILIPSEWIMRLDPRIKERIKKEVTKKLNQKKVIAKEKFVKQWGNRILNTKGKYKDFNQEDYNKELWKFELKWKTKTETEIGKKIDVAHIYSFNLDSYLSKFKKQKLNDWQNVLKDYKSKDDQLFSLDKKYYLLKQAKIENAIKSIARFDPSNAIELDIVREYLFGLSTHVLEKNEDISDLAKILRSGAKYPILRLKNYLIRNRQKIKPVNYLEQKFKTLGVSNQIGVFVNLEADATQTNSSYIQIKQNEFAYNPYRINVGSIGLCEHDYINQIISGAYIVFGTDKKELNPKYLNMFFETPQFLEYVNEKAKGGVRMNFKFEQLEQWKIPIPPIETQKEIVGKIERQHQIINGVKNILDNWIINLDLFHGEERKLRYFAKVTTGSTPSRSEKMYFNGDINWVLTSEIEDCKIYDTKEKLTQKAINDYNLTIYPENTILIAMYGQGKTRGRSAILQTEAAITQNSCAIVIADEKISPIYIWYYLLANYIHIRNKNYLGGGVPHLNSKIVKNLKIPIPDTDTQTQIISSISSKLRLIEGLRMLEKEARQEINNLISSLWKV